MAQTSGRLLTLQGEGTR